MKKFRSSHLVGWDQPIRVTGVQALVEAEGRVLTHATLLESVWGKAHREDVEYLRVGIRALPAED